MGPPLANTGEGERVLEDVRAFLRCSSACNIYLWIRDMGGDSLHGPDPGGVPPLVVK